MVAIAMETTAAIRTPATNTGSTRGTCTCHHRCHMLMPIAASRFQDGGVNAIQPDGEVADEDDLGIEHHGHNHRCRIEAEEGD